MMKKPMKGARKIIVDGVEYYWLYKGGPNVVIWCSNGNKVVSSESDVTGMENDVIERAKNKRYFTVTPRDIAEWIRKEGI